MKIPNRIWKTEHNLCAARFEKIFTMLFNQHLWISTHGDTDGAVGIYTNLIQFAFKTIINIFMISFSNVRYVLIDTPPSAITLSVMILSALLGMFQFLAVSSVTARDLVFATSKTNKNFYDLCFYSLKLATPWLFVGMALLESVLCNSEHGWGEIGWNIATVNSGSSKRNSVKFDDYLL